MGTNSEMPDINDICYIIAVIALIGILVFVILGDINISNDMPTWKIQVIGSTSGAFLAAMATLGAVFIKDQLEERRHLLENRPNIPIKITSYIEEDAMYGDLYEYIRITAHNFGKAPSFIDSFWITLQYDGKEHRIHLDYINGNILRHEKGEVSFPYKLLPGKMLPITYDRRFFEGFFRDYETGEYDIPSECSLIANFEDQLLITHKSSPFKIY